MSYIPIASGSDEDESPSHMTSPREGELYGDEDQLEVEVENVVVYEEVMGMLEVVADGTYVISPHGDLQQLLYLYSHSLKALVPLLHCQLALWRSSRYSSLQP